MGSTLFRDGGSITDIGGINFDVRIKSPAFIFSVAKMYLSSSPTPTKAILAVLQPSSIIWITRSS
uniref:Uncharacterized protein n=1 Tax=Glossina palpalis gambiensis TaxID=67801 RepID=A0A1B0AQS6_9MUSC